MAQKSQSPKAAQAAAGSNTSPAKATTGTKPTTTSGKATAKGRRRRGRSNSNRTLIWLIIGGVVVLFGGIVLLNWQALFGGTAVVGSPRVSAGTSWGPANAPVKIVEYSNFGCPHCKTFAENSGKTLRKDYEAGNKVSFEFKQFKLGDPSTTDAANASLCAADQSRFWDYHDLLFAQQGKMAAPFTKVNLKQYGAQLELDAAKFNACVDNGQHLNQVEADSQDGQSQGVDGTPTFIINGQKLVGDVPYAQLKAAVDAAVQKAG